MLIYPANLEPDEDTLLVTFPDIPEAVTFGEDEDEALARAVDALETMLASYMSDWEAIPAPSALDGRAGVRLPARTAAKVLLYQEMHAQGVRKAELARRLHWRISRVDRLLDLDGAAPLDWLDAAFAVLDRRLVLAVEAA